MSGFVRRAGVGSILCACLHVFGPSVHGQFKQIGPAPFSTAIAHQRIRALLDGIDPTNRKQTTDKLFALTPWFRTVLDEELIAAWERDGRSRVAPILEPLASPSVANGVVGFSWRKRTDTTLDPAYAPLLAHLMARYAESGKEFLADLLAPTPPQLSEVQAETVCRILIEMPAVGTWEESTSRILPRYRETAERVLSQERESADEDKRYRAHMLLAELRGDSGPRTAASHGYDRAETTQPRIARRRAAVSGMPGSDGPMLLVPPGGRNPEASADRAPSVEEPAAPRPYEGPKSGTLLCDGVPVPPNAEYVFRNLPPVKLQLDYDAGIWEARLAPGEYQRQRLVLRNKSALTQRKCVVHWSVVP